MNTDEANSSRRSWLVTLGLILPLAGAVTTISAAAAPYDVFVTDEHSGQITIIDGTAHSVTATFPVGKRPRGIQASPDHKTLFVAVSGTPISGPPQLDAKGNPIFKKDDDDDDDKKADKAADGIAVVDVGQRKLLRKIQVGSDPEQLALSADGTHLFVSNEDVGTASAVDIASGKVEHIVPVSKEPEGVGLRPDGKVFYVTCENDGEIYAVDAVTWKILGHFNVGGRPRTVDFTPDSSRAFIPSESAGQLHLINAMAHKLLKTVALPKGYRPMCVKVSHDGNKVYVSTGRAGTICVLDPKTMEVTNTIKVGQRPWGIAIAPDGKMLYAANGPSDDVSVIDLASEKEIAKIPCQGSPWGVAIVPKP
jgi:YVTN family beta-propeller protein